LNKQDLGNADVFFKPTKARTSIAGRFILAFGFQRFEKYTCNLGFS